MEFILTTPVAFLVFNRPDTTQRVFDEIRRARPPKLLVVADGPHANRAGEAEKCEDVRAIVDTVDWPCEVLKNYSEVNLGCKVRMSSGLDWVFEQVEETIILEDDCLPHPSFFQFCQELLEIYRHDLRIAQISGGNYQFGLRRNCDSYYFSKYNHVWGWASWRNRWQGNYDVNMAHWPKIRDEGWLLDMLCSKTELASWTEIFDKVHEGNIDTWDFQWTFACWLQGRLTVLPNNNLISNIGFGADATHTTTESIFDNIPTECLQFPLTQPIGIIINRIMDARTFKSVYAGSLMSRLCRKYPAIAVLKAFLRPIWRLIKK
jgi:hypothetical protein